MKFLSPHILSFGKKLFWSVISLFIAFVLCFLTFQYRREKAYKIELLNTQLQNYNDRLYDFLCTTCFDTMEPNADSTLTSLGDSLKKCTFSTQPDDRTYLLNLKQLETYVRAHTLDDLRVTLITPDGTVVYDNLKDDPSHFKNHHDRQEIQEALQNGSGYSIQRFSESLGTEFFYSAKYYPQVPCLIRTALPYNVSLMQHLKADSHFIWFTCLISFVLIFILYRFTHKLGMSITQLQQFALKADRNEPIDTRIQDAFPKNELGEISQHIIQIYRRLHRVKEDLYIEREKLITHLQISHEGLGVFTHDKHEILVNNNFTQYINLLSDKHLSSTEEIFTVPELAPITRFIDESQQERARHWKGWEKSLKSTTNLEKEKYKEKRMSLTIEKNGRIFSLECILFQDDSFEISINDITQEEERAKLKKQLTQNIAHELKTPVSSIQGYLETIVSNPSLPRERINTFLERSYAQSNRLTHLLRDISVLTRMEEAPQLIDTEMLNLSQLVRNLLNEVALELEQKQITCINLLPDQLILEGNASLIYSIFRNLTDNAIAYAGTGVTLTLRCYREDEQFFYFSFSDNGVGVPAEHLNRLFERFYRVDKGRSRKLGGTGLGLAIVKNAVLLHGGSIYAKSTPGGGLEFLFTLSKQTGPAER